MDKVLRSAKIGLRLSACLKAAAYSSLLFIVLRSECFAQGAQFQHVKLNEIRKLELCQLPEEMVVRIKRMLPAQMASFKEEYQETIQDESGTEMIKTIQLRFLDDHIMGYVKTAPLTQSSNTIVSNIQIKVPILWGCVPGLGHSQQHTAWSFADIENFSDQDHCVGWHQMKEGEHLLPPLPKAKRKKFLGIF